MILEGKCPRTNFDSIVSKKEARENHLAQSENWAKGRKVTNGEDTEKIDEKDGEEGINES